MLFCLPKDSGVSCFTMFIFLVSMILLAELRHYRASLGVYSEREKLHFFSLEVWLLLSCSYEHVILDAFGLICSHPLQS